MSNDKWFDEQYDKLDQELPPSTVDATILTAAKDSNKANNTIGSTLKYGWWATAAVVVLSVSVVLNSPELLPLSTPTDSALEVSFDKEAFDDDQLSTNEAKPTKDELTVIDREPRSVVDTEADISSFQDPQQDRQREEADVLIDTMGREIDVTNTTDESAKTEKLQQSPLVESVIVTAQRSDDMESPVPSTGGISQFAKLRKMTAFSSPPGCEMYSTAGGEILACDAGDTLVITSEDCEIGLEIAPGKLTLDENRHLQHEILGEIACLLNAWEKSGDTIQIVSP